MGDPASATCQACAHENCDAQATACTGLAVLPPNPSENCGSAVVALKVEAGGCTADDATKVDTPAFSCNAVSCAKKNFFKTAETGACLALKCFTDPASATCQACAHKNCDAQATACTGLAVLPPNPSENCGSK